MFLNLALALPGTIQQLGLVVVDEAQFITDPNRGITVELLLTFLIAARERGVNPQIIGLSAVIGDANRFNEWLSVDILRTEKRPVPLTEGVLDRWGTFHFVDEGRQRHQEQMLATHEVQQRRDKPSAQDVLVPATAKLLAQGKKVLVFRNARGKTEGCAQYLARDLGLPPVTSALDQLSLYDRSSSSSALRRSLEGGTAFHNSNLTREEREVVERTFRDSASALRVLVATTTVAAGINTPASTVIIAEQEFIGEDGREFTIAEYKNMAGRAGRLGFNEEGTCIILSETPMDTNKLLTRYVLGSPESLVSSFHPDELDTWLLRLLAQPQVRFLPRAEVPRLLAATYGGFLATAANPGWRTSMVADIENLLKEMIRLGLLEEENVCVHLTPLGKACGNSPLAFRSALRIIDAVKAMHVPAITARDLLALVQLLEEADAAYTPMFKRGNKESNCSREAAQRFGDGVVTFLQRYAGDYFTYWARCKRAAVLWDWISGEAVEVIEQRYTVNPFQGKLSRGDITRFADSTRWCLRSVHQIVALIYPATSPSDAEIEATCRSLEVGLPADALELLQLPERLTRGEYLALRSAGLRTCTQVIAAPRQTIERLLGSRKVEAIMLASKPAAIGSSAA
jgi:replicative superfamily II helicase